MRQLISLICFLFIQTSVAIAQTYKYIGIEEGLSNRRNVSILKDSIGYMWILSNEGLDRYDGKEFRHYAFNERNKEYSYPIHLGWQYIDKDGKFWIVGKKGRIFFYNNKSDEFTTIYKHPKAPVRIDLGYLDNDGKIWQCAVDSIMLYHTQTGSTQQVANPMREAIVSITQTRGNHYFVATTDSIGHFAWENGAIKQIPSQEINSIQTRYTTLYYHAPKNMLFIGTLGNGVIAYDIDAQKLTAIKHIFDDVNITSIKPLAADQLLIATEGRGIFQMDIDTFEASPYISQKTERNNGVNINNVDAIYIDEKKRVWAAHYPEGITIIDKRYPGYRWTSPPTMSSHGLINEQIHSVLEDCDKDLWMGTSNGISVYNYQNDKWNTILHQYSSSYENRNRIFLTLCEVAPGIIWAGGYSPEIYEINKNTKSVRHFFPTVNNGQKMRPEKYIRHITKDSNGNIWIGGYYYLKCYNPTTRTYRNYPNIGYVINITERNEHSMWIGTYSGLYLLDIETGEIQNIDLKIDMAQINTLYQSKDSILYIGTNGSGLLTYDFYNGFITQYHKDNSALVSNTINTILPEKDGKLMVSTENGITLFSLQNKTFKNWTKGQGLYPYTFNVSSGVVRHNGDYIFGSSEGVIAFPYNVRMPHYEYTPMLLSKFKISYDLVLPGDKGSPLKKDINETAELTLKYNQNTFSFVVSNINYDSSDNVIYYWIFENSDDKWDRLPENNTLQLVNLAPGNYSLLIRAISKEEPYRYFEERRIAITIEQPFWLSTWAYLIYLIILFAGFGIYYRIMALRKQKKIADEKAEFFINTAHDIRTPLTLIKAPLEELRESSGKNEHDSHNIEMALRNVESLLHMASNLINLEKAVGNSSKLFLSEHELNEYIRNIVETFHPYAISKRIDLRFESNVEQLFARFDSEKMNSIIKNLISNACKYTPIDGEIIVRLEEAEQNWNLIIKDSGIGIPTKELKKLFKQYFRASNAVNLKVTGSGMGLVLVRKLIKLHKGYIKIESVESEGTTISITIPKHIQATHHPIDDKPAIHPNIRHIHPAKTSETTPSTENEKQPSQRILIVEDNDELRKYLVQLLSDTYHVQACENGKEALIVIHEFHPELVISDIMMPKMRGDELCKILKNDINTSHIPILLLTALSNEQNIIDGLYTGADEYVVKPFSTKILKAKISSLLSNRELLRKRYANLEIDTHEEGIEETNCQNALDWKFMSEVKKEIDKNIANTDFTVDSLCAAIGMSRTSFYNKLKALTGEAPADFIRHARLKRAAHLLKEGHLSILEISEQTGFNDSKYFREVFKKYYHVSPSQYIRENNAEEQKTNDK